MIPTCLPHRAALQLMPLVTCFFPASLLMQPAAAAAAAALSFPPFPPPRLTLSHSTIIHSTRIYLCPSDGVAYEKFEEGGGRCFLSLGGGREGALKFLGRSGTPDALASFKSAVVVGRGKSSIINLPRGRSSLLSLSLSLSLTHMIDVQSRS